MTGIVVDASVILASLFEAERTPPVIALRNRIASEGALDPSLWWLEVANVLPLAERRGRITRALRVESLADLSAVPITTDAETVPRAWSDTLALAEAHRLTVYDAAYLELTPARRPPARDARPRAAGRRRDVRRPARVSGRP